MQTEDATESTLNAWQAQLEDIRRQRIERGGGQAGLPKPQQLQGKTGLQVMTAILNGELPHPYMADTFGPAGFEVRIVEYPGYGARAGSPSEAAFFEAAEAAFDAVVAEAVPKRPVYVLGESIGTGPACHLARVRGEA